MNLTYGSVCSGIEAASVAWHPLGWRAAWLAEIEPFPSFVLNHHYGSGRPLHMPSPDDLGLTDEDRDSRRLALKSVSRLPDTIAAGAPRNLGDFTRIAAMVRAGTVAAPDVLIGGTPCQAFSIAGLRNSLDDARGQLTLAFVDLANAIDTTRIMGGKPASIVVWENVPGVLSTKDNAFGCFLGALAGEDCALVAPGGKWPNAGCVVGPQRTIAWRVTDAQYFGVPQRRRRVFVVASARKGFDPTEVLFEFDGVRRDTAPSRQAWQDAAATIAGGARSRGGYSHDDVPLTAGTIRASDGGPNVDQAMAGHILTCVSNAEGSTGLPFLTCSNIAKTVNNQTPLMSFEEVSAPVQRSVERPRGDGLDTLIAFPIQNALRGKDQNGLGIGDADAPMYTLDNGSQHGVALAPIAFSSKDYGGDACYDLSPTLRAGNHAGSHANAGSPPAIAFDARQNCVSSTSVFGALGTSSPQAQAVCITGDITHTLKAEGFDASEDGTGRGQPIVAAFAENSRAEIRLEGGDGSRTGALSTGGGKPGQGTPMVLTGMAVRRLTPMECERLQAFPDFHTLIPISIVKASRAEDMLAKGDPVECIDGVWWKMAADGPRYKALGNSMCTNNISWIGRRIELVLARNAAI